MTRLRGNKPNLALLREFARGCDAHAALFPLKEFLLDIFAYCRCQVTSLTEVPKSGILSTGPDGLNPGDASQGTPGLGLAGVTSTGEAIVSYKAMVVRDFSLIEVAQDLRPALAIPDRPFLRIGSTHNHWLALIFET